MFKKIRNMFIGKHKGFSDILGSLICIVAMITVIIIGVYFFRLLEIKKDVNAQARSAMLILEQQGELTSDDVNNIKSLIMKLGFDESNITVTFNGDNTKAEYGEEVSIYVKATATYEELGISKIFGIFASEYSPTAKLYSISKAAS